MENLAGGEGEGEVEIGGGKGMQGIFDFRRMIRSSSSIFD
jgi:hypothetical protein